jgi:hypothetical protein
LPLLLPLPGKGQRPVLYQPGAQPQDQIRHRTAG